ncbi:MAG: NAD/NADP octopine/nopaline dehydrogenase family protein [Pseudomonadota bacterium]
MTTPMNVGIAGAGSIAFATAALLERNGHAASLWSPGGTGAAALAHQPLTAKGAFEGEFRPAILPSAEAVCDNDVVIVAVPGYGHRAVFDALAPCLQPGTQVIISSHASFGALYLAQALRERGIELPITCWGTTAVTGRRTGETEVTINTVRAKIDMCTVPSTREGEARTVCNKLFGDVFVPRDGLLAITLSNLNPQNHMGIALLNMTRMEHGEVWSQGANVTPKVGELLERLDEERLAIAHALGLKVKTIFEHFHLSFHVPIASISQMNQQMHAEGRGGTGPASADSRYVTEDVPYGLLPIALLGALTDRRATLHEAGIEIFSAMYGRDFRAENTLLAALDLGAVPLSTLAEAGRTGRLQRAPEPIHSP